MHIAAHGLGESFQIFLSVRVQRTVKIQKTLLSLGQLELPWEKINRKYELLSAALKQSVRQ